MNTAATSSDEQFSSAVDLWLAALLVALPAVAVVPVVLSLLDGGEGLGAALIGLLIIVGIYGGLLFPLYYRLEDDALLIRFGLVRRRIPYQEIRAVKPTWNPLSAPALSLRRLRVEYGAGSFSFALISPARREEFLESLARRTGLVKSGDQLQ